MTARARRVVRAGASALMWAGGAAPLLACPVCFRFESGPVTDGLQLAVLVLIGVTVGVLSGFGVFVWRFVRRARALDGGAE
jgi:hypothetical protein